jgi:alpha-L-arabinofuranosidase
MERLMSRRQFARSAATLSLSSFASDTLMSSAASNLQEVVVHTDNEIGTVRPELHGQFAEHVGFGVYGGLWVGKNSAIPNTNGYRAEAVRYLKELGVPVLRWPGGCFADDYHWRDGIGRASKRPRRVNIPWGGYVEDNSFGTHEFVEFCRLIGTEPYICGNVGSGSPAELRDWMEYCNYPSGSALSDERTANGSPEPFKVRYWGVGNESWGCGGDMTAEHYVNLFRQFAAFAVSFGGTRPFLIAVGPSRNDTVWSRRFMSGLSRRRRPDGFSMHYYAEGASPSDEYTAESMAAQLATFPLIEQAVIQQRALLDGYDSGRNVAFVMDEWGVHDRLVPAREGKYGRLWQECTMRSALAVGLGLNLFNRQADKLYMCNLAQMVNVRAPLLQTDGPEGRQCIRTTVYYVFALFKEHRDNNALRVETRNMYSSEFSVSASRSDRKLVISLVNTREGVDLLVRCSLGRTRGNGATARILRARDRNAFNTFDDPDRISPHAHPVLLKGNSIQLELPRLSVATVTVRLT